ncbi:MAG: hypothetical protein AAGF12_06650 [Myxococcota bacterium]
MRPRVVGLGELWEQVGRKEADDLSEWASLIGDLTSPQADRRPEWRIHDRTHLEYSIDYHFDAARRRDDHVWEAYFFLPTSLRLNSRTYKRDDIYGDLQSYVRLAVPSVPLDQLPDEGVLRLKQALLDSTDDARTIRELRLFACQVRASGIAAQRTVSKMIESEDDRELHASALALIARLENITAAFRSVLPLASNRSDEVATAVRWVDEDISRVVETLLASLSIELRGAKLGRPLAGTVAYGAVREARYRESKGLDGVGSAHATKREIEHFEFRRHMTKRFTSSVLWLSPEIQEAGRWTAHVLYAVAACGAMAFAVTAAFWVGPQFGERPVQQLWAWMLLAVAAYAGKDRIKALLQQAFSGWIARRFPHRRWSLRDRERNANIGRVSEKAGFVGWADLPEGAQSARNLTRRVELEAQARPEHILWHQKSVRLRPQRIASSDSRFMAITDIFRLDLRRWLSHTDDPKRRIVFADPEDERIYSATAPRVYNIGVVFRLRRADEHDAPWHRIRVVVNRKGIVRIDPIS